MAKRAFRIGQRFTLSDEALDNYGYHLKGVVYKVCQWYDHACMPAEMENDLHGHPGFDGMSTDDCLYDSEFNGSLYAWEMERVQVTHSKERGHDTTTNVRG